jgi:hypothetical protein
MNTTNTIGNHELDLWQKNTVDDSDGTADRTTCSKAEMPSTGKGSEGYVRQFGKFALSVIKNNENFEELKRAGTRRRRMEELSPAFQDFGFND